MAEQITHVFTDNGFPIWSGTWNIPIDWQHFQTSRSVAEILAILSPQNAKEFFSGYYIKLNKKIDAKFGEGPTISAKIKSYYSDHPHDDLSYLLETLDI